MPKLDDLSLRNVKTHGVLRVVALISAQSGGY